MKTFKEFTKIYEDGEGGSSTGTLGNIGGMGDVVSAQPSSTPGDVAGGTKGSGDIGCTIGTYTKQPAGHPQKHRKNKRNKNKKDKPYHRLGAGIDNFYRTDYVQSGSDGNLIQRWNTFTNEGNEYIIPVEPGRIYGVDLKKKGGFGQTLVDVYMGKNEDMFYKIGQLRTLGNHTIFYPEFRYIESGYLMSVPLVGLKNDIRRLTEEEKAEVLEQLHKDKRFGSLDEDIVTYYDILKKMVGTELK